MTATLQPELLGDAIAEKLKILGRMDEQLAEARSAAQDATDALHAAQEHDATAGARAARARAEGGTPTAEKPQVPKAEAAHKAAVQAVEDIKAARAQLVSETGIEVESARAELEAALDGQWGECQAQIRELCDDGKALLRRLARVRAHKAWLEAPVRGDDLHTPNYRLDLSPLAQLFELATSPAREEESELAARERRVTERNRVVEQAKAIRAERFPDWDKVEGGTIVWDKAGHGRCTVLPGIIEELTGEPEAERTGFMPIPKKGVRLNNVAAQRLMREQMAEWNAESTA
jgi:hypothetical protein